MPTSAKPSPTLLKYFTIASPNPSPSFMNDLKDYLSLFPITKAEMIEEVEKLGLGSMLKKVVMKAIDEVYYVC